jgi:AraC-like DNA-binding protein
MALNEHAFGGAVQRIVATLLPDGYPDIQLVSEVVRLSPRTLQRRLHAEGLTFAGVVARTRFAEALRMLGDPTRKVIDVALDLGYSDPAHFTRAFGRWSGITPREYRRRSDGRHGGVKLPPPVADDLDARGAGGISASRRSHAAPHRAHPA